MTRIWGAALVAIPWVSPPPCIDGKLDDSAWDRAPAISLRLMGSGEPPSRPTRARLAWRAQTLFVGFECRDDEPRSTLTMRDAPLWQEEVVELFLAPDAAAKLYLEIEVNPGGVLYDAWVDASSGRPALEGSTDFDLDGLQWAAARSESGWTAELAVPLDRLPHPRAPRMLLNLTRIERPDSARVEYQTWAPTRRWFHEPERWLPVELDPAPSQDHSGF